MFEFIPGATSKSIHLKLRDSTTGQGKTGLVYNSSGVLAGWTRLPNGTPTALALATLAAATSPWAEGGFKEVDPTNQKGLYRLDIPDAALASGAAYVTVSLSFDGTIDTTVLIRLRNATELSGAGSVDFTVTVLDDVAAALAGAAVWVTTDSAGTTVVAGTLRTDEAGQATFWLDAGTYYLWVVATNYNGTNPTTITVT